MVFYASWLDAVRAPPKAMQGDVLLFWSAEDLEVGKMKYRKALDTVERCRANNQWRGFDADEPSENLGLIRAKLPTYIRNEILNKNDND